MKYLLTIAIAVVVVGVGALLYAWSGSYNIAATEPHWKVTTSLIDMLRDRSVAVHSEGVQAPNLDDPRYLRAAAPHYHGMCRLCHGAPGARTNEFAKGLYPSPPDLTSRALQDTRSSAEMYWIVKHGIKMTGMPAFGPTHDETELWGLVVLARALPETSAKAYAEALEQHGETAESGHDHAGSGVAADNRGPDNGHSHNDDEDHEH